MKYIFFILNLFLFSYAKADLPEFKELIDRSALFEKKIIFPTQENRLAVIAGDDNAKQAQIVKGAQNSYPIMHTKVSGLIKDFLLYKRHNGSNLEKAFYEQMNESVFINRLLQKRPLMFMGKEDFYLLKDGKTKGKGGFEAIGTDCEKAPLILADYLSYDEMQLAALIGVSTSTYFINNGNRYNRGKKEIVGSCEPYGVYVSLVGARFEKPGYMEWQSIIITPEQNSSKNGYGLLIKSSNQKLAMWSAFYEEAFPTYDEAKADIGGKYIPFNDEGHKYFFNCNVYRKRLALTIEPFLLDAQKRGLQENKKVYVHVVGLGLGVWQKIPAQAALMLEVYEHIIQKQNLSQIADINFSWFPANAQSWGNIKNGEKFKTKVNDIMIHFSKRNPADPLVSKDKNKLLVACYAWDGNSYPGNEYWAGHLTDSGDPAAACCSTIVELQNPEINSFIAAQYMHSMS